MKTMRIFLPLLAFISLAGNVEAKKVKLTYNFQAGQSFTIETTSSSEITQDVMGQVQEVSTSQTHTVKLTIKELTSDGNFIVEETLTRLAFKALSPMGDLEYDTDTGQEVPDWAMDLLSAYNETYTYSIDPLGNVSNLIIPETLQTKFDATSQPDGVGGQMMAGIGSGFSGVNGLTMTIQNRWFLYPEQTVKQGGTWERTDKTEMIMSMESKSKMTLSKSGKETNEILAEVTMAPTGDSKEIEMEGMIMQYDITGAKQGSYLMSATTGLVQSSETVTSMSGVISVDSPQLPNPMTIPMTIKVTEKITVK